MSSNIIRLRVPNEFPVLIENLAREVIRENPKSIVNFAAEYFENLVKERERRRPEKDDAAVIIQKNYRAYKGRRKSILLKEEKLNNASNVQKKPDKNIHSETLGNESAAVTIQRYYRGHAIRKRTSLLKQQHLIASQTTQEIASEYTNQHTEAATRIQASYRGHKVRKLSKQHNQGMTTNLVTTSVSVVTTSVSVVTTSETVSEESSTLLIQNASATKIQATYRGFKTRKVLKQKEASVTSFSKDAEHAAVKIQSSYRGYRARKRVEVIRTESKEKISD